jgi:DNA replicative helicase MCM subunit Mcm2 (Cdc46/Mcm family)
MAQAVNSTLIHFLWTYFYPHEPFGEQDRRILAIDQLYQYFRRNPDCFTENVAAKLTPNSNIQTRYVSLCTKKMAASGPFEDFMAELRSRPREVLGCVGIALSMKFLYCGSGRKLAVIPTDYISAQVLKPRMVNFGPESSFSDIKANAVNQLVSLKGRVVRVDRAKCLVIGGMLYCEKCQQNTFLSFEDGIFNPPPTCPTKKCTGKYLELRRTLVRTEDVQAVRIQEIDSDLVGVAAGRIPRTLEVEVTGDIVNKVCVSNTVQV